ncbi:hypothetical protein EDB81DRAFT_880539 [Dactylonectria macrodidyma]|uniref:DUF7726 domain-containing protein n=1 Tax=Dactylonectria macrodidyma TaxID=307937 RepID=A0A9P9F8M4_9HYPO|nr:hypothetical protein EDB81DRAFT_880539 [Dactylonectria macrodidyma]
MASTARPQKRALATSNSNIAPPGPGSGASSNSPAPAGSTDENIVFDPNRKTAPTSWTPVPVPVIPGFSTSAGGTAPAPKPAPKPAASRKRKSDVVETNQDLFPDDAPEIDSDDERLVLTQSDTCNAVRRKIRNWTESGAMKVGEFQNTLGVSSKAYGSFMNRTGTWDGDGCDTYFKACAYFKKRELQGLPLKASKPKKPKTAESAQHVVDLLDTGDIELPGEANNRVPVFDTCDEVRKKIRALLAKDGVTQAAFVREISKTFTDGRNVSPANLRYFMGRKGPVDGNTNVSFYAGYVFFEKQRVKAGKPKTKFREEMESVHRGTGIDVKTNSHGPFFVVGDSVPTYDKYGCYHTVRGRGRGRRR